MQKTIKEILRQNVLRIPRQQYDFELVATQFGPSVSRTRWSWLIPCSHSLQPPATLSQIRKAEAKLKYPIPSDYRKFLEISNGAQFFQTPYFYTIENDKFKYRNTPRYQLLGCRELVELNAGLLLHFRLNYKTDPEFSPVKRLNYMAFCSANDGDFQSLLLDSSDHRVFFLFHELMYRPYNNLDTDWYTDIAPSLESWFKLIIRTGGWGGRGDKGGL